MNTCRSIGCTNEVPTNDDFCFSCAQEQLNTVSLNTEPETNAQKYPAYFKSVEHLDEVDVYQVHALFNIQDPSGAIQHASKKLLLSGVRTGKKSKYQDIQEARDTLNRWLEIFKEDK